MSVSAPKWESSPPNQELTAVVKTFIRYGVAEVTCNAIKERVSPINVLLVDDTPHEHRKTVAIDGVTQLFMEPDSGLCAGRNFGFQSADTEFVYYTDDDAMPVFPPCVTQWVLHIMKENRLDLFGWKAGRMFIEDKQGCVRPVGLKPFFPLWSMCDVTENAFFARTQFLLDNPFNDKVKINGEHWDWFWGLKQKGGCRIAGSPIISHRNQHIRNKVYQTYRRRWSGHSKNCLRKWGVNRTSWSFGNQ